MIEGINPERLALSESGAVQLVKTIVSTESDRLPKNGEILRVIEIDSWDLRAWQWDAEKNLATFTARRELNEQGLFPLITEDFILALIRCFRDLEAEPVVELACGFGWLSHWIMKYGFQIKKAIDDFSWERWNFDKRLGFVVKRDAVRYAKRHGEVKLFILSWPYMDRLASRVWKSMKPGQFLLYIGEGDGGCNADEKFFKMVDDKEVPDDWGLGKDFLSFWGIHDRPVLYRKDG